MTIKNGSHQSPLPADEAKSIILGILNSFLTDEEAGHLGSFFRHVGFDIRAVRDPAALPAAWLAHYRTRQGVYDVNKACTDLATWPLIAARIAELRAGRD